MKKTLSIDFSKRAIDLPLLVFLILFLDVKFVIKVVAILLIVLMDRDFRFGLSFRKSRLPLFYALIIGIEIIKYFFITRNYSFNYLLGFGMGMLQWGLCLLAIHTIRLHVDRNTTAKLYNTIKLFYFLNFLVSLFFLTLLIVHPSSLTYWGQGSDISIFHPSAGDAILGITFDTSTANATICCLGLIFFVYKRDIPFMIICGLAIVICTSNTTFIFTVALLVTMVLTVRSKKLRLRCLATAISIGILYLLVSAQNREYIHNYFVQLYVLNKDTAFASRSLRAEIAQDTSGKPEPNAPPVAVDSNLYKVGHGDLKKALGNFFTLDEKPIEKASAGRIDSIERKEIDDSAIYPSVSIEAYLSKPGKLISFAQTCYFLKMTPIHFLFGAGTGNFSSKLAFRLAGTGVQGSYPKKYNYVAQAFRYNHLKTYLTYAKMDASRHSVLNFPFSIYNQLLGEYGFIGFLLFVLTYLGFFVRRYRRLSYGRYMLLGILAFFLMEYWFELLSLVVIFELFMFLNLKEGRDPALPPAAPAD
ncbi:MAG TPA: hypothetical protein VGS79_19375 [Puia sp.]|nr:hypothetical protein [Puia sp.]